MQRIPGLIRHMESVWLCAADDVEALTIVMQEALIMPEEKLKEISNLGYKNVIARHSITVEALKLAQYIKV